ncbi:MAG TPA: hypothetical protein VF192_12445 [Longimicrobiales bacterium]
MSGSIWSQWQCRWGLGERFVRWSICCTTASLNSRRLGPSIGCKWLAGEELERRLEAYEEEWEAGAPWDEVKKRGRSGD